MVKSVDSGTKLVWVLILSHLSVNSLSQLPHLTLKNGMSKDCKSAIVLTYSILLYGANNVSKTELGI